ncbi:MAG TPA: LysM domain-containing protein, partial [Anaerolineaceae bacterium]|nr:LysM domain-containing protein [Anaerolineaceae bacterium]
MKMRHCSKFFILIATLLLSSCGPKPNIPAILPPEPSHTPTRVPSAMPTFVPSPSHTASPSPSPMPTATPEPVTFKVGRNDDMFSVALYFGVSLEALKTANPQVIPNAMSIGTELIIPITPTPGMDSETEPSPSALTSTGSAPEVSAY